MLVTIFPAIHHVVRSTLARLAAVSSQEPGSWLSQKMQEDKFAHFSEIIIFSKPSDEANVHQSYP